MQYEVKNGETIFDVAVNVYGSVAYCVKLAEDNSIDLFTDITNYSLYYDPLIKNKVNIEFRINTIPAQVDNSYFIKKNQSIYDLALMFGYGIENVVDFVKQYNFDSLDNIFISGTTFNVTKVNTKLSNYVTLNNIIFGTNLTDSPEKLVWDGQFIIWDGTSKITWA